MIDPGLEAEYNNKLKVADHPAVMAGWRTKAEAFRAAHAEAELDLRYGEGPRHLLDVFWPGPARSGPLAMFVHGGYWQWLDKSWFSHMAGGFLAHGIALAVPSYDLCPTVRLSDIVEDVRRAAAFLMRRHETDLHVSGHSAGGHLTAMLLATDFARFDTRHRVVGGCAISGLFDLEPLVRTSINSALGLDMAEAIRLSPVYQRAPEGLLQAFVGEKEGNAFTAQTRGIAMEWNGRWGTIPGADHFTAVAALEEPGSTVMRAIAADIAALH